MFINSFNTFAWILLTNNFLQNLSLPLPILTIIRHNQVKSGYFKPLIAEQLNDSNGNIPCEFSYHGLDVWPGARAPNPSCPKSGTITKGRRIKPVFNIYRLMWVISARSVLNKWSFYLRGVKVRTTGCKEHDFVTFSWPYSAKFIYLFLDEFNPRHGQ